MVAELPVGDNLADHVFPLGLQFSINQSLSANEQSAKTFMSLMSYLLFGDGQYWITYFVYYKLYSIL